MGKLFRRYSPDSSVGIILMLVAHVGHKVRGLDLNVTAKRTAQEPERSKDKTDVGVYAMIPTSIPKTRLGSGC